MKTGDWRTYYCCQLDAAVAVVFSTGRLWLELWFDRRKMQEPHGRYSTTTNTPAQWWRAASFYSRIRWVDRKPENIVLQYKITEKYEEKKNVELKMKM